MVDDISVRGSEDLEALARRLKDAGETELRKELLRGIRASNKATILKIRESALANLPRRGGLAELVAKSQIGTRASLSGSKVGVRIRGLNKSVRGLNSMNAGAIRHPVFADGEKSRDEWTWVNQRVTPWFFTKPIEHDLPHIRTSIQRVMADVARKIEG